MSGERFGETVEEWSEVEVELVGVMEEVEEEVEEVEEEVEEVEVVLTVLTAHNSAVQYNARANLILITKCLFCL